MLPISEVWTISDIRSAALAKLDPKWAQYINGGAEDLTTLRANELEYNRYRIMPRILRDVEEIDTSKVIFGTKLSWPFGFSPAAMHCLAHPDGEVATSHAAAKAGIAMCLSAWATKPLEEVIIACDEVESKIPYAIQKSSASRKDYTLELVARAHKAGYRALLITADSPTVGRRLNELRNGTDLPEHLAFPNISYNPNNFKNAIRDATVSASDYLPWLSSITPPDMEIWLKGIYTPEDVITVAQYPFVKGVIISNHGGRQLDSAPATLEALSDCVAAARSINSKRSTESQLMIGIDGGIRRGSDVFKALALGADICFAGRIPYWGLAFNGQDGVERALQVLREEFEVCMRLSGCKSLADIGQHSLAIVLGGVPGIIERLPHDDNRQAPKASL